MPRCNKTGNHPRRTVFRANFTSKTISHAFHLAISNSPGHTGNPPSVAPARQFLTLILILAFLMLDFNVSAASETLPSEKPAAPPSAEQDYLAARQRFQATPDNAEAAVQLGRACFDAADAAASAGQRAQYAQEGIDACRKIITLNPKLVQGHYYLALNLGQLARTKSIGALKLVNQMETTLKHAIELDPAFDYAGPHRAIDRHQRTVAGKTDGHKYSVKAGAVAGRLACLEGSPLGGQTAQSRSKRRSRRGGH